MTWNGCIQVPQELATLTTLTKLNLIYNWTQSGPDLIQSSQEAAQALKMRVTPANCRFLLRFCVLADLTLEVTQEESDALAEFITELQRGRNSPINIELY